MLDSPFVVANKNKRHTDRQCSQAIGRIAP